MSEYKKDRVRRELQPVWVKGKWHLILTTDTSLSYLKAMEQYQVSWTIEVFFKESKQHRNLGKSQSRIYEAQIADTTTTKIQYILLTLRKRFEDYETRGEIFRAAGEEMLERRLHVRLWELLIIIMKIIIETLDVVLEDIDKHVSTDLLTPIKLKGLLLN